MSSRSVVRVLCPLLLVSILAACGDTANEPGASDVTTTTAATDPGRSGADLEGSVWTLASVGDGAVPIAAGTKPGLLFLAGGTYSADTGCNTVTGTYATSGTDGLTFSTGAMTQRGCVDEASGTQELAITDALSAVRTMERSGDTLVLSDDAGAVRLTFSAVSTNLANSSWKVLGVNTGDAVESNARTERLTIEFGADGTVSGNSGCNTFRASYTADGDRLAFDAVATTKMACEPDAMATEAAFVAALERVAAVRRTASGMDLLDEQGATQVTVAPAE